MVSEPDTGQCASEETEPRRGWTRDSVPARTLGFEGGLIRGSHIDWRREQVPARTLASKGVDCEIPHRLGKRTKHSL